MRAAAAILASALVLALGSASAAGGAATAGDTAVASAACVWKSHAKRVVRRVRRNGRWVKVVRIRRWRTCVPLRPAPPSTPWLSVRAHEFSFVLSRPEVPAGEIMLEFENSGEDPHDLNIAPAGGTEPLVRVAETDSLQRVTQRVSIPAPGAYVMWCSLPDHRADGMEADLVVAPPAGG
jgi:hypothetical protein